VPTFFFVVGLVSFALAQVRPNITRCIEDALCECENYLNDECRANVFDRTSDLCYLQCCCLQSKCCPIADVPDSGLLLTPPMQASFFAQDNTPSVPTWNIGNNQRSVCDFAFQNNDDARVNWGDVSRKSRFLLTTEWKNRPNVTSVAEGTVVTGVYVSVYAFGQTGGGSNGGCYIDQIRVGLGNVTTRSIQLSPVQFLTGEMTARYRRYGFVFTPKNFRLPSATVLSRESFGEFASVSISLGRTANGNCHVDCVEMQFMYEPVQTTQALSLPPTVPATSASETTATSTATAPATTTAVMRATDTTASTGLLVSLDIVLGVAGGAVLLCALMVLAVVCFMRGRNADSQKHSSSTTKQQTELAGAGNSPRGNIYGAPPLAKFSKLSDVSVGQYQNPEQALSVGEYKNPEAITSEYSGAEFTETPQTKSAAAPSVPDRDRKKTFIRPAEAGGMYQSIALQMPVEGTGDLKYVDLAAEDVLKEKNVARESKPVVYETFEDK
jgi:hypothetical protein